MRYSDAKGYSRILSDPLTYRFLSESGAVNECEAFKKIDANRKAFANGRSIYWSITKDRRFLGYVALHGFVNSKVYLSVGIVPDYRRKGIATRVINEVIRGSGIQGKEIEFATHESNLASFGLFSKLKLKYGGLQSTKFGRRHIFTHSTNPVTL